MDLLYDYHVMLNLGFVKGTRGYVNLKKAEYYPPNLIYIFNTRVEIAIV